MRIELPVANGLRTDHPVPNVPFVDDSHLPLHDGEAIETHGRHDYNDGWGRYDHDSGNHQRWGAFTTDQFVLDYAWLVRHDPQHGRTVLLYAHDHEKLMHAIPPRDGDALLHRAGGYWWDGTTWHRPPALFDHSTEQPLPVPVPDAVSVTAREYLTTHPGTASAGRWRDITTFTPTTVDQDQWRHDLAYWAGHRPDDGLPLEQCFVDLTADELQPDELLDLQDAAHLTGLSQADLTDAIHADGAPRAARFPFPQRLTHTGTPRWSRPVVRDWLWERQRAHPEPVVTHLRTRKPHPDPESLLFTLESAALWEMQETADLVPGRCSLGLPLERAIGWLVTEQPGLVEPLFGGIVRRARRELHLSDATIRHTLRDATQWALPGDDEDGTLEEFLQRVLPPSVHP